MKHYRRREIEDVSRVICKHEVMSDSALKQELLAIELKPIPKKYRKETWPDFWHRALTERESQLRVSKAESAALRLEITKLTLLSDSQLANQERLTEELEKVREELRVTEKLECEIHVALEAAGCPHSEKIGGERHSRWLNSRKRIAWLAAELATERANQERLVGEKWIDCKQELPPMVRDRGYGPCSDRVLVYNGTTKTIRVGALNRPEEYEMWWMNDDDAEIYAHYWQLLPAPPAPKDTPTEPK